MTAGIMIVVVNIVGGIIIGTLQKGMDVARAAPPSFWSRWRRGASWRTRVK